MKDILRTDDRVLVVCLYIGTALGLPAALLCRTSHVKSSEVTLPSVQY